MSSEIGELVIRRRTRGDNAMNSGKELEIFPHEGTFVSWG